MGDRRGVLIRLQNIRLEVDNCVHMAIAFGIEQYKVLSDTSSFRVDDNDNKRCLKIAAPTDVCLM